MSTFTGRKAGAGGDGYLGARTSVSRGLGALCQSTPPWSCIHGNMRAFCSKCSCCSVVSDKLVLHALYLDKKLFGAVHGVPCKADFAHLVPERIWGEDQ